ncbi:alanine--tRNA ligase [Peptoniphilus catoniae]|uniref:alanine--tRNA ligase n=1 Tax=Peptoniphilus catoniae TaxID=1660341 RepID=UPI0015D58F79|nr:alanine--tRNA ligase [Peptoniphilus catoniae]
MKRLKLHDIRTAYLEFFKSKGHLVLPSFSLVPKGDKSLLLIGAGMAPMKKYFTGELTPPSKRVTTCQKCIRTGDIENVGKTDRHATFFEMLGNFSFGDYFKNEAIEWAYEFLTKVLEINPKDIWVSVYFEDDEAFNIWHNKIGIPEEKIVRLGKEDNFWELEVGPSGPCSEIYIDRGEDYGCGSPDCKPGCECDRFIEVWNLVFTQFDKDENKVYNPLDHPNIDTGMGLERLATILQGTDNIFEIDAIKEIIYLITKKAGYKYTSDSKLDVSVRVITDHIRAITFMISDNIRPSNEGRGYVLRRLIRRASRHGRLLGIKGGFLSELSEFVIDSWGQDYYSDLKDNKETIMKVIKAEEEKFLETLESGMEILDSYINSMKNNNEKILSGEIAFKLYDTYGFPVDLTEEILNEKNMSIDMEAFKSNMEEQRQRAREARHDNTDSGWSNLSDEKIYENLESEFVGYEYNKSKSNIIFITKDDKEVENLSEGHRGIVVLDKTPFYGESGGQVGDTGIIYSDDFKLRVLDTKKIHNDLIIHIVDVEEGTARKTAVNAEIDAARRNNIRKNHSVTHLLHKALKEVLGDHVNQAGSEVLDKSMRFDFTHYEAIKDEDLEKIERIVNEKISESLKVKTEIKPLKEAYESGAIGLFEEKYGEKVRIVSMGDYSTELCGGTHVNNTSEIQMFKILSENGISSGVRRIEAITGPVVYDYLNNLEKTRNQSAALLKSSKEEIVNKIEHLTKSLKNYEKEINLLKLQTAKDEISKIINKVRSINSINYVTYKFNGVDLDTLRNLADLVRNKLDSVVVVFATENDGKLNFVCAVSKDLVSKGINAGKIVKGIAKIAGGGGGGRPDMATAGGKDLSKVDEALSGIENLLN